MTTDKPPLPPKSITDWLWNLAAEHAPEWFTMPERAS